MKERIPPPQKKKKNKEKKGVADSKRAGVIPQRFVR